MSDENNVEKLDTREFFKTIAEINRSLVSIETSTKTFPAKFDKIEDRLERYHESAMKANNKADRAWDLARSNEDALKLVKSAAAEAQDKADRAIINAQTITKEFEEYREDSKQNKNNNKGYWIAIGTAVLGAIITIWATTR